MGVSSGAMVALPSKPADVTSVQRTPCCFDAEEVACVVTLCFLIRILRPSAQFPADDFAATPKVRVVSDTPPAYIQWPRLRSPSPGPCAWVSDLDASAGMRLGNKDSPDLIGAPS
jgi:hypothetical protein